MINYKLQSFFFIVLSTSILACNGQAKKAEQATAVSASTNNKIVGGGCDGCELMYVDMPATIKATDTSSAWNEAGKRLLAKGVVYLPDGKTAAPGIIIYYWQTDSKGYYSPSDTQSAKSRIHGHIRGWVKTDERGRYALYTIRPAPYPNLGSPAHIHFSIKEPSITDEYYIDDIVFEGDSLVNTTYRNSMPNRAGNGITKIKMQEGLQIAERNIILGLNIPNYPKK